jgi:hypothetical protein
LLAALKDKDWKVRSAAASALGELVKAAPDKAPAALPALLAALKDENSSVRLAAASALDGYSTQQLIEGYLTTPALEGLRAFIINNRLCREALVMQLAIGLGTSSSPLPQHRPACEVGGNGGGSRAAAFTMSKHFVYFALKNIQALFS